MKKIYFLFYFCISILFAQNIFFSPIIKTHKVSNVFSGDSLKLSQQMILLHSEKIVADSTLWSREVDYQINYSTSTISFTNSASLVEIEYKILPQKIISSYFLYEPVVWKDSSNIVLPQKRKDRFSNTTNLSVTGSKTIAVSIANDKDFGLDQSLFLNINGELGHNLFIEAQLTDSQSPITPEGDSREISNLDQLFIRLYGKQYELSFGDLEATFDNTNFINYNPKFEGLKARYFPDNEYMGAFAISKGKKITITLNGINAKQGPYYLNIEENVGVQIVPGSEEIYLDGVSLQRGDDYTIDYAEGSITFSNDHFITYESFIQASFQYSDEEYDQHLYLASTGHRIGNFFQIKSHFIYERDDKNSPLQGTFTKADIDSLEAGGDGNIIGNGIQETDASEGLYMIEDDHFVYTESDSIGTYLLSFYYAGYGNGDYEISDNGTYYTFVGENNGSYLIGKKLPTPEDKMNFDLILKYNNDIFSLQNEFLLSHSDQNLFSSIDDNDNDGFVIQIECSISPRYDLINPHLFMYYRKTSKNLNTFYTIQDANETYELSSLVDSLEIDEWKSSLSANIADTYQPNFIFRYKKVKQFSDQYYAETSHNCAQFGFFPEIKYRMFWSNQHYSSNFIEKTTIQQHDVKVSYRITNYRIGCNYYYRNYFSQYQNIESNETSKIKWKWFAKTESMKQKSSEIFVEKSTQDSLLQIQKELLSFGNRSVLKSENHQLQIDYSHHILEDSTTTHYDLADLSSRHSFYQKSINIQTNYGIKNVQFYPKEREFIYVGNDMGSYDQDSIFVGLGEGDYDWEITGIDYENPSLSVEVKANMNVFFNPAKVTSSFWKKIQSETNLKIIENSKLIDKEKIYYFNPKYIMNETETIYGFHNVRQTIWFDVIPNKILPKLRIEDEKIMDNRYQSIEKTKRQSGELSCTIFSVFRSNLELGYERRIEEESRYHSLITNGTYRLEIRNKILNDLSITSQCEVSNEKGKSSESSGNYDLTSLEIEETFQYYLLRRYRFYARLNLKKNKKTGDFLSYFSEKRNGIIFKWIATIDYKINDYTTANFQYTGKSYPEEAVNHQLGLEIKAEF